MDTNYNPFSLVGKTILEIAERLTDYTDNRDYREVIIVGQKC